MQTAPFSSSYPTIIPSTTSPQQQSPASSNAYSSSNDDYSSALVPATGPGTTVYTNYDLMNLGNPSFNASFASSSTSTAPAAAAADFVPSFAKPPSTPNNSFTSTTPDVQSLEARDEAFVQSLPSEIVEEQKRIMAQIQERNKANNNSRTVGEMYNHNSNSSDTALTTTNYDSSMTNYNNSLTHYDSNTSSRLPEEVHPGKYKMKETRKIKTAVGSTTGAVIGGIICGPAWPIGAVAGAAAGGYATKVAARSGERRQQRKWESKNFNEYTAKGVASVQSESVVFT